MTITTNDSNKAQPLFHILYMPRANWDWDHTALTCPWMLWFWWTNLSCSKATRPPGPSSKSPQSGLLASNVSKAFRSVAALRLSTSWGSLVYWLVVWTPLKNISQLGWLFPIYGKIKNVPNHQPVYKWVGKGITRAHKGPQRQLSKLAIGELGQWLVAAKLW